MDASASSPHNPAGICHRAANKLSSRTKHKNGTPSVIAWRASHAEDTQSNHFPLRHSLHTSLQPRLRTSKLTSPLPSPTHCRNRPVWQNDEIDRFIITIMVFLHQLCAWKTVGKLVSKLAAGSCLTPALTESCSSMKSKKLQLSSSYVNAGISARLLSTSHLLFPQKQIVLSRGLVKTLPSLGRQKL